MAIELSNLTFTEQDDVVPASGVERIINTGVANTLAGNDAIIGTNEINADVPPENDFSGFNGIFNFGTLNTADGNDTITGTTLGLEGYWEGYGIYNADNIYAGDGNDIITGIDQTESVSGSYRYRKGSGLCALTGTFDTGDGNDIITGISKEGDGIFLFGNSSIDTGKDNDIITGTGFTSGLANFGSIDNGDGNDTITGTASAVDSEFVNSIGINNYGTIDTGNGEVVITGTGSTFGIYNQGTINTGNNKDTLIYYGRFTNRGGVFLGDGNDSIIGDKELPSNDNSIYYNRFDNYNVIETGDGNDIITSRGFFYNYAQGIINTGNGEDSIIAQDGLANTGRLVLGDGNDLLTAEPNFSLNNPSYEPYISNYNAIETGDGNDEIFSVSSINNGDRPGSNHVINTGNGDDLIRSLGGFDNRGEVFLGEGNDSLIVNREIYNFDIIETGDGNDMITSWSIIYNNGTINTGNGQDSIIAEEGFDYGGSVLLGNGEDYIKGFGSGELSGGNDEDTLELTSGTYTVGRWYTAVTFTKGSSIMITSEFEKLIAGSTTYDFNSLTKGQTITVA